MGSNMSTKNEKKAPIIVPNALPRDNNHAVYRRPTTPPVKHVDEASNRPKLSLNYESAIDGEANVIEIVRPLDHCANINRVVSFHSSACWRDYVRASKHSDKLVVLFFSAKWCGFCRYIEPFLDDLASQYPDVEIDKLDIDALFDISREYKVHAMPTFTFIKNGIEIDRVVGTRLEDIRLKIEKHRAS